MLVSVIVPFYNSAATIKTCVESILCQSFRDFELLLVDDGSTDDSLKIVKDTINGENRATIIEKNNGGVSSARNVGIEKAKGQYITFIDSDDNIAEDYLANMVKEVDGKDYDMVFAGAAFCSKTRRYISLPSKEWLTKETTSSLAFIQLDLVTSPFAKLYKKKVIMSNNLHFDTSMSYAEDRDFNIVFFHFANKIKTISYIGYYYQLDITGSLSKQRYSYKMINDFCYWRKMYSFISPDKNDELAHRYLANRLFNFLIDDCVEFGMNYPICDAMKLCSEAKKYFDANYIRNHLALLSAPWWQKQLLRINYKLLTCSLLFYVKATRKRQM